MSKITLSNVSDITQATSAQTTINSNSTTVQTAFDNTLSRDGTSPNQMSAALDMNSNQILNLPAPATINSPARLQDVLGTGPSLTIPPVGTSGATVPLLNANNTFSGTQTFTANPVFPNNSIPNPELAQMNANSIKGNNTGVSATPLDLTATQATAMLNPFSASGVIHAKGLVPDPGSTAGSIRFLREDTTWSIPFQNNFNVLSYGAKGDYSTGSAGMTNGSAILTAGSIFTSNDVGKHIAVTGAGTSGATLFTTISTFLNPTQVTLGSSASTTVVSSFFEYGSDDTPAFQAAINAVVTAGGGTVYIPSGKIFSVSSLNMTNITFGVTIAGEGVSASRIMPFGVYNATTGHVFDCTGSEQIIFSNFQLGAFNGLSVPATGLFLAAVASGTANRIRIRDVYFSGQYTVAAFYNYGVPSSDCFSSDFYNYSPGAGNHGVVYFTATNVANLTSAFATVTTGAQSMSDWTFVDTEFHKFAGAGADNWVVRLDGASNIVFLGGVISGGATGYVFYDNTILHITFLNVTFETEGQPVEPLYGHYKNSGTVTDLIEMGCIYLVATSLFNVSATTANLVRNTL